MTNYWPIVIGVIVVIGASAVAHFLNRHLFSFQRQAEEEVRRRCLDRPRLEIGMFLENSGVQEGDRDTVAVYLSGIANVIKVPPETLRPEDCLGELCRVQFPRKTHKPRKNTPDFLIAFSDELLDYFMETLDEDRWVRFLETVGVESFSEDAILDAILKQPLSNVLRSMVK